MALPKVWFAAVLGLLSLVAPAASRADENEAKQLFEQAEARYAAREYREALALYEKAFEAKPLAGFHFNMGQCYRALGDHEKAVASFKRYLSESKKTPKHAKEARRLIKLSEAELTRKPAPPPDRPPVKPPDNLVPEPALTPPPVAASQPEPSKEPPIVEPPPRSSRRHLRPAYFWTGVGLSAALLLTGTITGAVTIQKGNRYNDPATPYGELQSLRDSGQSLKVTSTVMFALGASAAVATTVLYFFTDFHKEPKSGEGRRDAPMAGLSAAPLPGGAMLSLTGVLR
jgi:hypothetical protein